MIEESIAEIEARILALPVTTQLQFVAGKRRRRVPVADILDAIASPEMASVGLCEVGLCEIRRSVEVAEAVIELELAEPWCATEAARFGAGVDRLRDWIAAGRPRASVGDLAVYGDRPIVDVVRAVVASLPAAVAHHVVGNVAILCSGVETRGFCRPAFALPCSEPTFVVLAVADPGIVAHELAHAWHMYANPALTAEQYERVVNAAREVAVEEGRVERRLERLVDSERAADTLATIWGFPVRTASDEHLRRLELADIARRVDELREPPSTETT